MYSDFQRPMIDLDEEAIETKTSTKECRGMFVLKKMNGEFQLLCKTQIPE